MFQWTMPLLLQTVLVTGPAGSYGQAYQESMESGRPLVVVVGATWCPACVSMKQSTIPMLKNEGAFRGVLYATVDKDSQPQLAAKLMRGRTMPQIVVFSKQDSKWRRQQLVGAQNLKQMRSVLNRVTGRDASRSVALKPSASRPTME